MREVDVAIIGAGSAGLSALSQVRRVTDSYVFINGGELGTTCARVGCMPSKAAIQVAEDFHGRTRFDRHGIEGHEHLTLDEEDALEHVRDLRDLFVDKVLSTSTDEMGDEFIDGYAQFIDVDVLEVNGQKIRARKIIIATGSRPIVPQAWKDFGEHLFTTDDLFELEQLPTSVAVIGLGVIGLEMGQTLHRLGVTVTGIDKQQAIGGLTDPVVNQIAIETLGKEFPLWLGHEAHLKADPDGVLVKCGEQEIVIEKVFVAMGRRPNLECLGLDKIGIPLNTQGLPDFDRHTMQIGDFPIFIAGDVSSERPILHEANDEGRIAGFNAVHEVTAFARKTPLVITFSDPNIASVGLQWHELDQDHIAVGEMRFGPLGRALIMAKNRGVLRVYADKSTGRLLGGSMIGPKGENLAHLLAWSIQQGLTVYDLLQLPFYHPTIEEGLQAALYDLVRQLDREFTTPLELKPLT